MALLSQAHLHRIHLPAHLQHITTASVKSRIRITVDNNSHTQLHRALSSLHSTSDFTQLQCQLQPRKAVHRSNPNSIAVVRAVILLEWVERICAFIKKTPAKLFLQTFEDDVRKVATTIEKGAEAVKDVAEEIDRVAEKVEKTAEKAEALAEKAEALAEKVETTTEDIERKLDEALEVLDGEKKIVITGYKVIDTKQENANRSIKQEDTRSDSSFGDEKTPNDSSSE